MNFQLMIAAATVLATAPSVMGAYVDPSCTSTATPVPTPSPAPYGGNTLPYNAAQIASELPNVAQIASQLPQGVLNELESAVGNYLSGNGGSYGASPVTPDNTGSQTAATQSNSYGAAPVTPDNTGSQTAANSYSAPAAPQTDSYGSYAAQPNATNTGSQTDNSYGAPQNNATYPADQQAGKSYGSNSNATDSQSAQGAYGSNPYANANATAPATDSQTDSNTSTVAPSTYSSTSTNSLSTGLGDVTTYSSGVMLQSSSALFVAVIAAFAF